MTSLFERLGLHRPARPAWGPVTWVAEIISGTGTRLATVRFHPGVTFDEAWDHADAMQQRLGGATKWISSETDHPALTGTTFQRKYSD